MDQSQPLVVGKVVLRRLEGPQGHNGSVNPLALRQRGTITEPQAFRIDARFLLAPSLVPIGYDFSTPGSNRDVM